MQANFLAQQGQLAQLQAAIPAVPDHLANDATIRNLRAAAGAEITTSYNRGRALVDESSSETAWFVAKFVVWMAVTTVVFVAPLSPALAAVLGSKDLWLLAGAIQAIAGGVLCIDSQFAIKNIERRDALMANEIAFCIERAQRYARELGALIDSRNNQIDG